MKVRKIMTFVVLTASLGTMLAACSTKKEPTASTTMAPSPAASATGVKVTYPLTTDKTLSYWEELTSITASLKPSLGEIPFYQEWQKRTGVKLKFISPAPGAGDQIKSAFNVMLASGDLPDMIEYDLIANLPGGPDKAINDGYILKLNDLLAKNAPNLMKYLKEHPEVDKLVKTDNGSYFTVPFIRGDDKLMTFQGPTLRKDWLDELGLQVPTTIDEWTTVLKAFKEKKGATAPLGLSLGNLIYGGFVGAFGVKPDFYQENGKVKYGPAEPGYKDFLTLFHKWYAEGLLDKNFTTLDGKTLDANILSGATGATIANAGGGIGRYTPLLVAKDPKGVLNGAPYPVLKKGDKPKFGQKDFAFTGLGVAITKASKNPELAIQMLDYGYSEEGSLFFNFGTPGVSYNMVNGYPTFSDLIMNNPDKLPVAQAMTLNIRGNSGGPFIQDKRYVEQYFALDQQKQAVEQWKSTDASVYNIPPLSPTPEEASETAKILNDMNTFVNETTLKMILGSEPIENFDKYIEKLKSLKLDRIIQLKQAALDRFNKR
ncbi:extracellular solute-binding protein [Paenibacillus sp. LMG 31458]|uniref:Extracellular solute-binding protein n=2 Tax=Paenibacillus phytorum TaxID=2654977 RepID=A0ABX1Y2E9_9BACL|nr:extracellular solute-binding protein [Paenibacillus phytorum]NOU74988.1 extracellular solute-binding protein [Paenibacillus phytorum]